jgi:hypothetical protein
MAVDVGWGMAEVGCRGRKGGATEDGMAPLDWALRRSRAAGEAEVFDRVMIGNVVVCLDMSRDFWDFFGQWILTGVKGIIMG